jgi:hypothetical protein
VLRTVNFSSFSRRVGAFLVFLLFRFGFAFGVGGIPITDRTCLVWRRDLALMKLNKGLLVFGLLMIVVIIYGCGLGRPA